MEEYKMPNHKRLRDCLYKRNHRRYFGRHSKRKCKEIIVHCRQNRDVVFKFDDNGKLIAAYMR